MRFGKINILEVSNMSRKIVKTGTEKAELKYFYTEITKENVNKWNAIQKLADYMGIEKNEIAAIGDNINDLEMITEAGLRNSYGK
ncbi:MAG: HAD hydrolase family protein [Clostridia bacterium]|nr:HAD hydrolase family protein [Clostridia bacterium]